MTDATTPTRGYAICGEPRSGSNYLCQILESTGVLGRPRDYLNVIGMREKEDPSYPADTARQLEMILNRGTGGKGVYGFKMFSMRFDDIRGTRWAERLPGLRFLHLEREDLLGQALSDWRVDQTGQFRSTAQASPAPRAGAPSYDRREIARRLARIAHNQARWRQWFARNGIDPLRLSYEQIVADPQRTAEAVARHLDVDEAVRVDLERVNLKQQRDGISAEWRARFVAEARDLSYLDDDSGRRFRARLGRLRRRLSGRRL